MIINRLITHLTKTKEEYLRYKKYWKHEAKWKRKGDTRCEFTKLVDKCRYLELSTIIYNPGKCSNSNHNHKGDIND